MLCSASESHGRLSGHSGFEVNTLLLGVTGDAAGDILLERHFYVPDFLVFQLALHTLRRALSKGLRLRDREDDRFSDIGAGAPWLHSC